MSHKGDRKQIAILRVLHEAGEPLTSAQITDQLNALGHEISERTVRFHLIELDQKGFTDNLNKRGRQINQRGIREFSAAGAYEKIGYLTDKIDRMTCSMRFDLAKKNGTLIVNTSLIENRYLEKSIPLIQRVYGNSFSMGELVGLASPGERIGQMTIPPNMVGIATVCSVTLNGIFLSQGIPTASKFGGLLELKKKKATRFVEIIHYSGTTLDPLEIFIQSGMTDYLGAVNTGNGRVGAGFREIPSEMRSLAVELSHKMAQVGLGGAMAIGSPGRMLLEIPVNEGRVPIVVMGGLNPMAILEESGIKVVLRALSGLVEYKQLFHYSELPSRARRLLIA